MRRYEVKDICRMTGLTRKQLFDYEDVIKPVARKNKARYKIYDENSLDMFRQVSFYKMLGRKPEYIKDIISKSEYDKTDAFNKLVEEIRAQKRKYDDILYVAEHIQEVGYSYINSLSYISSDISEVASRMRIDAKKKNRIMLRENIKAMSREQEEKLMSVIKKFTSLKDNPEDTLKQKCIESLENFYRAEMGANRYLIMTICVAWTFGGAESKNFDSVAGSGAAEYVGNAMADYYFDSWMSIAERYLDLMVDYVDENKPTDPEDNILQSQVQSMHKELIVFFGEFPPIDMLSIASLMQEFIYGSDDEYNSNISERYGKKAVTVLENFNSQLNLTVEAIRVYAEKMLAKEYEIWKRKESKMNKAEINEFIRQMAEFGDVWRPEEVENIFYDSSLEEAVEERTTSINALSNRIKKILNEK